ncbi:MAG: hypothetical protein JWP63_5686 [Candidatus Solibacter sp.]|nr:hypothetical protein [Candidatus Solibacter sp.]
MIRLSVKPNQSRDGYGAVVARLEGVHPNQSLALWRARERRALTSAPSSRPVMTDSVFLILVSADYTSALIGAGCDAS